MNVPKNCIDLSFMPFDHNEEIGEDEIQNKIHNELLQKQLSICDSKFNNLLLMRNQRIVEEIEKHIKTFMRPSIFSNDKFRYLHGLAIILGMHISDHSPTLDNIASAIEDRFSDVKMRVMRFTPQLMKQKKVINNLLEREVMKTKYIVLILEQTQMIDRLCLDYMITILTTMDSESQIKRNVILIFCMASDKPPLNHILTVDRQKVIRPNPVPVVRLDPDRDALDEVMQVLLDDDDISFKLGPNIVSLLDNEFVFRDPTVANTKYLFTYALKEHYENETSFILDLIKSRSDFNKSDFNKHIDSAISSVRNLQSVVRATKNDRGDFSNLNWDDKKNIRDLVVSKVERLTSYHKYLMSQLSYYFHLLRDEMCINFPGSFHELYEEVFKDENLGRSQVFYDAIDSFGKLSADRALRRLNKCLDNVKSCPKLFEGSDMINIVREFSFKLAEGSRKPIMKTKDCQVILGSKVPSDKKIVENISWALNESSLKQNPFLEPNESRGLRSKAAKAKKRVQEELNEVTKQHNEEIKSLLSEFCGELHNHASKIMNPLKMPLSEIVYFDDVDAINEHCVSSNRFTSRLELMGFFGRTLVEDEESICSQEETINTIISTDSQDDQQVDVQRLYKIIYEENEEMCLKDLYELFEDKAKGTNIVCEIEEPAKRRKTRGAQQNDGIKTKKIKIKKDEGLLRARFINAIQDLEFQGIVKRSTNLSKKGILFKVAWL